MKTIFFRFASYYAKGDERRMEIINKQIYSIISKPMVINYYDENSKQTMSKEIQKSKILCDFCNSPEPTTAIAQYDDDYNFWITHVICDDCRSKIEEDYKFWITDIICDDYRFRTEEIEESDEQQTNS